MPDVYSFSAKGKRENNEDFIFTQQLSPDCSLHLVADGIGGYSYGELASTLACVSIAEYMISNIDKDNTQQLIAHSLDFANNSIKAKRKQLATKMGTTIAGVVIKGTMAYFFWLGDVRIYLFRNSEIIFQSEDHSFINEMKRKEVISTKEIERYGNIVTQSLSGNTMEKECPIVDLPLWTDDVLLICSDGLWRNVHVPSLVGLTKDSMNSQLITFENSMEDNYSILRIWI
ncbi:MAG: protein phosphatase 2C domain-containing protein [Prolixibacteraceae bacterium]